MESGRTILSAAIRHHALPAPRRYVRRSGRDRPRADLRTLQHGASELRWPWIGRQILPRALPSWAIRAFDKCLDRARRHRFADGNSVSETRLSGPVMNLIQAGVGISYFVTERSAVYAGL